MERRKFYRVLFPAEVTVLSQGESFPARLKDIAYGGAYLLSERRPPVGSRLELIVRLEGMQPPPEIRFLAEVVRHGEDGFGVKLVAIDLESLTHLRRLLYFNLPDADQAERELRDLLGEAVLEF
ncbi:PilZ domain-containing protein [Thermosulfurimonas marina]|uniref:PilZ domain-containing protein n=1 Tax=Thermosulfurimonas marina TaxID=2047767 RepID=A0A6H1WQQ7_9BACT|nr:PilZ domain-containing protein [Thermosulfurimonas marina]QJA05476.1 PilZ domain-containing protein [Thermosulfurimonas marina]